MSAQSSLLEIAKGMADLYDGFTTQVLALGSKASGSRRSSRMGESLAHWVGGGHVTTAREQLCEQFLTDVHAQVELLATALATASAEEAAEAAYAAVDVITRPQPADSNATTVLMKRAVIGQAEPLLSYLKKEQLLQFRDRLAASYPKRQILPVEKQILKRMDEILYKG